MGEAVIAPTNAIAPDELRGAMYRVGQAFNVEMAKLGPAKRRDFLVKAMEGIRQQVAMIDENTRRNQQREQLAQKAGAEAAAAAVSFGKGQRSSDTL